MQAVWNLEGLQPMARVIRVAGAQMGPIQRADPRALTLRRLIALLEEAAARRAELIAFPELAFTTFFPRWLISEAMLNSFFERAMPNANVEALFNRARTLGVGILRRVCRADSRRASASTARCTVGPGRHHPGQVPQDAPARLQWSRARAPASSSWRSAISNTATWASPAFHGSDALGRNPGHGHADLQRPPLARGLAYAMACKGWNLMVIRL